MTLKAPHPPHPHQAPPLPHPLGHSCQQIVSRRLLENPARTPCVPREIGALLKQDPLSPQPQAGNLKKQLLMQQVVVVDDALPTFLCFFVGVLLFCFVFFLADNAPHRPKAPRAKGRFPVPVDSTESVLARIVNHSHRPLTTWFHLRPGARRGAVVATPLGEGEGGGLE